MTFVKRVATSNLPTRYGGFTMFGYETPDGKEHVALTVEPDGDSAGDDEPALVRIHSECLTGDLFGSRRCDCGEQLEDSMKLLQRKGRGVLLYLRQEGRGIGLTSKIRAYNLQDQGLDTVEANLALGLPEDARDYSVAAEILRDLGISQTRVLTNNPAKIEGLRTHGIEVTERLPLRIAPNPSNVKYLETKRERMGHLLPETRTTGESEKVKPGGEPAEDINNGPVVRPAVTVSYAQTLDGRLATRAGSSQWISCSESLHFAHQLRAEHDAVMVGAGTVCADDPRLTVRRVEGEDPLRVVVDSTLRISMDAAVLADGAAGGTILAVTGRAPEDRCEEARSLGATVLKLPAGAGGGVDLGALLLSLSTLGVRSVMVEGGAGLITALLRERLVDRFAVCVAPKILGRGIEAVGDLGISNLDDSVQLADTTITSYGVDLVLDSRVEYPEAQDVKAPSGR